MNIRRIWNYINQFGRTKLAFDQNDMELFDDSDNDLSYRVGAVNQALHNLRSQTQSQNSMGRMTQGDIRNEIVRIVRDQGFEFDPPFLPDEFFSESRRRSSGYLKFLKAPQHTQTSDGKQVRVGFFVEWHYSVDKQVPDNWLMIENESDIQNEHTLTWRAEAQYREPDALRKQLGDMYPGKF